MKRIRLDFWNNSWWKGAGNIAKGAGHALADVLLPKRLAAAIGVVSDLVDDGKLNDSATPGSKVYETTRTIFTTIYMVILAILLMNGIISFDQFVMQIKEVVIPFLLEQPIGLMLFMPLGAVVQGQFYRVKRPVVSPETKIYGQGEAPNYYEFTITNENGEKVVCRDEFDTIISASVHVDYPHGKDVTKRNVKYIEDNIDRFELVVEEEELEEEETV